MDQNYFVVLTDEDYKLPLYMTSAGGWKKQNPVDRESGFSDYQWIQTVSGEGRLTVEDHTYTVNRGQGMLLYPYERHHYSPAKEDWEVQWITFNGRHTPELLRSFGYDRTQVLYISNPDLLLKRTREAQTQLSSKNPMRSIVCSSIVYQLLLDLFAHASPSEVRSKHQHYEQLSPVFDFIADHYDQVITLQQLADLLGVSPQHTCLLFQQSMGLRPFEFITRFRIQKAKELLLTDLSMDVKAIAQKVGYEHPSYFIKLFKQHEGVTPSVFRSTYRSIQG